jgi:hypothetical protein
MLGTEFALGAEELERVLVIVCLKSSQQSTDATSYWNVGGSISSLNE